PAADAGVAGRDVVATLAGPPPGTPEPGDAAGGLVAQWLDDGFYVSIDRTMSSAGERFYRTIRGLYVPATFVGDVEIPAYRGLAIGPEASLPIGFVPRGRPAAYRRATGRGLSQAGHVPRQAHRFLRERAVVGGAEYWITSDDLYVRAHNFSVVDARRPPEDPGADGKWILIDLSDQVLVAYEWDRPVYAALVSTGKPNYETPPGRFRIAGKHVSATMDGITELDGAYSIEDVPWAMFYNSNFAIHGAFWHNRFGMTRSKGCVNMSPQDARWIFEWSGPRVPDGWHGVLAGNLQPGTLVVIEE
ncbi:MAG: L,D-transpeptidase, partial [Myxococcota bacterium]|nr:L,D-transpeptidase [Myxococcota bacterium]